jgi:hypothetical protein
MLPRAELVATHSNMATRLCSATSKRLFRQPLKNHRRRFFPGRARSLCKAPDAESPGG